MPASRLRLRRTLVATVVALLAATAALPAATTLAATATVRVEGQTETLLGATSFTLGRHEVSERSTGCPEDSASAALESATRGNWDREEFIQTILGEEHSIFGTTSWWIWVNHDPAQLGACELQLRNGDVVLFQAGLQGEEPNWVPGSFPVELEAPARVNVNTAFSVHVTDYRVTSSEQARSTPTAGAGYLVSGGGTSATANREGDATLTIRSAGRTTLKVTDHTDPNIWGRSVPVTICVENGRSAC